MIWGRREEIHPIILGEEFVEAGKRKGETVKLIGFAGVGHFEIATPLAPTWPALRIEIRSLLKME